MSKLKRAKAIQAFYGVLGILVGLGFVAWIIYLLCLWAGMHFMSFAIVMGIILLIAFIVVSGTLLEWSAKVIKTAEEEEAEALRREKREKARAQQSAETPKAPKRMADVDDGPHPWDHDGFPGYKPGRP